MKIGYARVSTREQAASLATPAGGPDGRRVQASLYIALARPVWSLVGAA